MVTRWRCRKGVLQVFNDNGLQWIKMGGKHSLKDFGAFITQDTTRDDVKKKVVMVNIPYSNNPLAYDFSEIAGEPIYNARTLTYNFKMKANDRGTLNKRYSAMKNHFLSCKDKALYDSAYPKHHFTAKCIAVSDISYEKPQTGRFSITFTANPYLESEDYSDIPWDIFSFNNNCINQDRIVATNNTQIQFYSFASEDIIPRLSLESLNGHGGRLGYVVLNGKVLDGIERDNERWFKRDDFIVKPATNTLLVRGIGAQLVIDLVEEVL